MLLKPITGIVQKTDNGYREYDFTDLSGNSRTLASLTTILSRTKPEKDKAGLKAWRKKVGDAEADRIMTTSIANGNLMHENLENDLLELAGEKILHQGIKQNDHYVQYRDNFMLKHEIEPLIIEGALFWYDDKEGIGFAGTVDCVANVDGVTMVVDHKSSLNPKREDWVLDYKLQVASYAAAVNFVHGLEIKKGLINVATASGFQQFELDEVSLKNHFERAKDRMRDFYLQDKMGTLPASTSSQPVSVGQPVTGQAGVKPYKLEVPGEGLKRVEMSDGTVQMLNVASVEYYV